MIALFGLFLLSPFGAIAKHIIGGEITYVCLGDGTVAGTKKYRFTMHIYRDAKPGTGGAPLDGYAHTCTTSIPGPPPDAA